MQKKQRRSIRRLIKIEALLRKLPSRKNRVFSLVVLTAVPLFVLSVGFRILQGREATEKELAKNSQIQQQIEQLDAQNQDYLAVLNNTDPEVYRDYVIRTARERLGLSLPGDQVFVDRSFYQSKQP